MVNPVDVLPNDPSWHHASTKASSGVQLHYVRQGKGAAVLLLHGWPGFWYDWRRVIPALSMEADVIAPDFRGFGDSDKPDLPPAEGYTPEVLASDTMSLLDTLGIEHVTVAAHDFGATVAQVMSRIYPKRIRSLVLFNPPYGGIGSRRFEPAAQREFWYQHFHNLDLAEHLVGYNRDTVRLYLSHFYDHWTGQKDAIYPGEFEAIVDTYAKPGAIRASIAYYRARDGNRAKEAVTSAVVPLSQPATILWGEQDPVIPSVWSDRLGEFFSHYSLQLLPGVGHFVPVEAPEAALRAIRDALAADPRR